MNPLIHVPQRSFTPSPNMKTPRNTKRLKMPLRKTEIRFPSSSLQGSTDFPLQSVLGFLHRGCLSKSWGRRWRRSRAAASRPLGGFIGATWDDVETTGDDVGATWDDIGAACRGGCLRYLWPQASGLSRSEVQLSGCWNLGET